MWGNVLGFDNIIILCRRKEGVQQHQLLHLSHFEFRLMAASIVE